MRTLFYMVIFTSTTCLIGCPYDNWEYLYECDQEQCSEITHAKQQSWELEEAAQELFAQDWEQAPFTIEQALKTTIHVPVSCGQATNNRINEEAFLKPTPGEIVINHDIFQLEEGQITCALMASLVHAGAHLTEPGISHRCLVEVDDNEACPDDKLENDPILAADSVMYTACVNNL